MALSSEPRIVSKASTTFVWKHVIMRGPPRPLDASAGQRPAPLAVGRRDPRKPLTVTVAYLGGPEAKWKLTSRGRVYYVHGAEQLHDALSRLSHARR